MIGDKTREFIANARRMTWPTRMMVTLDGSPLVFMDCPDTNVNIVSTFGTYHLVYNTITRNGEQNRRRFAIVFDFNKGYLKCSNWHDFENQVQTNDIARFLYNYTNICPEMFCIAEQNEGMHIPVCFNVIKYNKVIREQLGVKNRNEYVMLLNPFKPTHGSRWGVEEGKVCYTDLDRPDIKIIKEERANENK